MKRNKKKIRDNVCTAFNLYVVFYFFFVVVVLYRLYWYIAYVRIVNRLDFRF